MIKHDFPKLYKKPIAERLDQLSDGGAIDTDTAKRLLDGQNLLNTEQADKMIENVIGVFGLPVGLGLNFIINGKPYVVPMVVEEPSIVAAVSSAAKVIRQAGGFSVESAEQLLIGQIVVSEVANSADAGQAILDQKQDILNLANSLHPNMVARGGGAIDVEVNYRTSTRLNQEILVVHLLVDSRDAMGANLVNSMCEGVANLIETITGGNVFLRILSNYYDRSIVRAKVRIPHQLLDGKGFRGKEVSDRIALAAEFANIDPHRAATNNKGIMNGIDAVAIATGNDWRAIEAAAHAYAARTSGYGSLSSWTIADEGQLVGELVLPLKVGIVGGNLQSNPSVADMLKILKVESARELSEVMAAVGLAQNFAALRALVTEGIQKGHMSLHARSVALAAGADPDRIDDVARKLVDSGQIKLWKARDIISKANRPAKAPLSTDAESHPVGMGNGKVILFGEHAVVYGRHALANPIPQVIQARVWEGQNGVRLNVPQWGIDSHWMPNEQHRHSIFRAIDRILLQLGLTHPAIRIEMFPQLPRAAGLGSSAAAAVAIIRALNDYFRLNLDNRQVNQIAFESERIIHGTPSGIDNTVATFARPLLFRRDNPPLMETIDPPHPLPLLIAYGGTESLTSKMVAKVRKAWQNDRGRVGNWFDQIDRLTLEARISIERYDLERLGELMNKNQKILKQLDVSSSEQDDMIRIARQSGATGAKITGAGGGGAIVALCPERHTRVAEALEQAGYRVLKPDLKVERSETGYRESNDKAVAATSAEDRLIVVNQNDEVLDYLPRSDCHAGQGILHRAFSIHIFNRRNQILLQQRSSNKQLWPLFWSNSCCSHPRAGETTYEAANRRLMEELGITARLEYIYKFSYQARYNEAGSENELCSVFIGRSDGPFNIDASEIADWRFVGLDDLEYELKHHPERFTPWFKMEWEELRRKLPGLK